MTTVDKWYLFSDSYCDLLICIEMIIIEVVVLAESMWNEEFFICCWCISIVVLVMFLLCIYSDLLFWRVMMEGCWYSVVVLLVIYHWLLMIQLWYTLYSDVLMMIHSILLIDTLMVWWWGWNIYTYGNLLPVILMMTCSLIQFIDDDDMLLMIPWWYLMYDYIVDTDGSGYGDAEVDAVWAITVLFRLFLFSVTFICCYDCCCSFMFCSDLCCWYWFPVIYSWYSLFLMELFQVFYWLPVDIHVIVVIPSVHWCCYEVMFCCWWWWPVCHSWWLVIRDYGVWSFYWYYIVDEVFCCVGEWHCWLLLLMSIVVDDVDDPVLMTSVHATLTDACCCLFIPFWVDDIVCYYHSWFCSCAHAIIHYGMMMMWVGACYSFWYIVIVFCDDIDDDHWHYSIWWWYIVLLFWPVFYWPVNWYYCVLLLLSIVNRLYMT
jgi:hypothetical protein